MSFSYTGKGRNGLVDLARVVAGGELHANPRLALRDHGEGEADDVDPLVEELRGDGLGQARVIEHDGDDGVIAFLDLKTRRGHRGTEANGIRLQLVPQAGRLFQQLEHLEGGARDGRSQGVAEQVRPRSLPQQLDDLPAPGDEASGGSAKRLTEGPGDDVDSSHHPAVFM